MCGCRQARSLTFGHGEQACPGRHFAGVEIKVVLARTINECDVKSWAGRVRPKTFYLDENMFSDPRAKLHFRHGRQEFLSGKEGIVR